MPWHASRNKKTDNENPGHIYRILNVLVGLIGEGGGAGGGGGEVILLRMDELVPRFLLITNLMHSFVYLFSHFISLHVSSIKCSSSGDRIVLIHLVWLVCVTAWCAGQEGTEGTNHTRWCIHTIRSPDDEHLMLETCREMKWINKYMKKCIGLVIKKNLWRDARSTKHKNRATIYGGMRTGYFGCGTGIIRRLFWTRN